MPIEFENVYICKVLKGVNLNFNEIEINDEKLRMYGHRSFKEVHLVFFVLVKLIGNKVAVEFTW